VLLLLLLFLLLCYVLHLCLLLYPRSCSNAGWRGGACGMVVLSLLLSRGLHNSQRLPMLLLLLLLLPRLLLRHRISCMQHLQCNLPSC
jgi:hypothetical protein